MSLPIWTFWIQLDRYWTPALWVKSVSSRKGQASVGSVTSLSFFISMLCLRIDSEVASVHAGLSCSNALWTFVSLQAEFTAMRDQYMRAGEGFIICYSITDRRSFHEVREFKQLIYRVRRTDDTPVVLVGNKSDLKQLRQVRSKACNVVGGHLFLEDCFALK